MPRPTSKVLVDEIFYTILTTNEEVHMVFYKGQPFQLRRRSGESKASYDKTAYPHAAPAFNLAEKLNKTFNCKDFTVHKASDYIQVESSAERIKTKEKNQRRKERT